MITQTVTVTERNTQNIIIGRRGTYSTEEIVFELSSLISDFGDGSAVLMVKRPTDASAYPAVTVRDGDNLVWTISETDTSFKGHGECELFWYVENGLAKSIIWPLTILRDIGTTEEEPPDPYESWIDSLTALGAKTLENAQAAEQSASDASSSAWTAYGYARGASEAQYYAQQARDKAVEARQGAERARDEAWEISSHYPTIIDGYWAVWHDGQYWKTSYKAEGVDGRGITDVTGVKSSTSGLVDTYTLTVTYTDGGTDTITFTVTNGRDGTDGTDGVSPGVTITDITGGHRVTITDKDHPTGQSFDVLDGEVSAADLKAVADSKAPVIIDTASGSIASFSDGADGMPVKSLVCQINPVQSGTGDPSPVNVRPITGFTGLNLAKAGRNVFNPTNGTTYTRAIIAAQLQWQYNSAAKSVAYPCKPGIVYTVSVGNNYSGVLRIGFLNEDLPTASSTTAMALGAIVAHETYSPCVATSPADAKYIIIQLSAASYDAFVGYIQIEIGTSASPYEEFNGETITVSWQTEAGTVYGGSDELISGELKSEYVNVILDETAWTDPGSSSVLTTKDGVLSGRYKSAESGSEARIVYGLSNYFATNSNGALDNAVVRTNGVTTDKFQIIDYKTTFSVNSYEEFLAIVQANPIQVVYKIAQPIVYQLDPVTVSTLYGQNNIFADCGDVSVDYPCDTKLYIDRPTEPAEDDMIADSLIASGKYFFVNNRLFLSTASIAVGAMIIPGSNCVETSIAEALNTLNS